MGFAIHLENRVISEPVTLCTWPLRRVDPILPQRATSSPSPAVRSGTDKRMLRAGRHLPPRTDLYLSKGHRPGARRWQQGIPRRPEERAYDGNGNAEVGPDPNISNKGTTGRLIRRMLLNGWTREQISNALTDRANTGGSWYRWQRNPDDLLDRFIQGSRLASSCPRRAPDRYPL